MSKKKKLAIVAIFCAVFIVLIIIVICISVKGKDIPEEIDSSVGEESTVIVEEVELDKEHIYF